MPDARINYYEKKIWFATYENIQLTSDILSKPNETVVLLPHQEVPLQLLIAVMQHFKRLGMQNVSIGHSFGDELKIAQSNGSVK